jgi:hypothetical protein
MVKIGYYRALKPSLFLRKPLELWLCCCYVGIIWCAPYLRYPPSTIALHAVPATFMSIAYGCFVWYQFGLYLGNAFVFFSMICGRIEVMIHDYLFITYEIKFENPGSYSIGYNYINSEFWTIHITVIIHESDSMHVIFWAATGTGVTRISGGRHETSRHTFV